MKKPKKWQVVTDHTGSFEGRLQIWDKNGNAPTPAQAERLRRQIEKFINA